MVFVTGRPKQKLEKSMAMFEEAQRLSPGGLMGIRRPYNFVIAHRHTDADLSYALDTIGEALEIAKKRYPVK